MVKSKLPSKFFSAGAKTGLPDDILIKIGEITLNWNRAEVVLEELIWTIAGWGRTTGALVTHDLGNVSRDQLCRNMLHHRLTDDELKSGLNDLLAFVSELRTRRNSLIHSIPTSQLNTDTLPQLEKRSAKAATGQIRISHFLITEIDDLRIDIAMATYAMTYAAFFVQRDLAFTLRDERNPEDQRSDYVWEKRQGLPNIYQIRTRLKTIRSQPQHANRKPPQPRSSGE